MPAKGKRGSSLRGTIPTAGRRAVAVGTTAPIPVATLIFLWFPRNGVVTIPTLPAKDKCHPWLYASGRANISKGFFSRIESSAGCARGDAFLGHFHECHISLGIARKAVENATDSKDLRLSFNLPLRCVSPKGGRCI